MTNLQIIEALCEIIKAETELLRHLTEQYEQLSVLDKADASAIEELCRRASEYID